MTWQRTGCVEELQARMSLALDGMLGAAEERELQAHLATCPDCRAEWEALQAVSRVLARAPLVAPRVDLALRIGAQFRLRRERQRWIQGLVVSCLWVGLALSGSAAGSILLGWLLLRHPALLSTGVKTFAQLLLTSHATLRGLWLLAASLPSNWLSVGVNGCVAASLMLGCLWAWLAFGPRPQCTEAA